MQMQRCSRRPQMCCAAPCARCHICAMLCCWAWLPSRRGSQKTVKRPAPLTSPFNWVVVRCRDNGVLIVHTPVFSSMIELSSIVCFQAIRASILLLNALVHEWLEILDEELHDSTDNAQALDLVRPSACQTISTRNWMGTTATS